MSYTYLLESGEESSADCYSDIPVFVLSRLSLTAEKSSCNDSATESSQNSQSGTMCELSTANRGAEKSIAFAEASPAKTSQRQGKARASMEREAGYGESSRVLLARYDRDTRSWKTLQCSLFGDSDECLETFPRSGMMQNGLLWEQTMWARPTGESVSGYWRTPKYLTPKASDKGYAENQSTFVKRNGDRTMNCYASLSSQVLQMSGGDTTQQTKSARLNPNWVEWLMGWPIGYTDSKQLAMDKFRSWQQQLLTF